MAFSKSVAARIRQGLSRERGIDEKKMFGGIGFLLHGNMCVGVWKDSLIARIGPERYADALSEPYVREFDITGRPMKGWVLVEPDGIDQESQLSQWIECALEFVSTLPPK